MDEYVKTKHEHDDYARFPFYFHYCPECGKILSEQKYRLWSHDHSYEIGYILLSKCVFCDYSERYSDVE